MTMLDNDAIRKCSSESREIIGSALKICTTLGHSKMRLEHFLIALLKYHKDKPLQGFGQPIDVEKFITKLYYIMPPFEPKKTSIFRAESEQFSMGSIESAKVVRKMLILSLDEAAKSKSDLIEPEHILNAIYLCSRGKLRKMLAYYVEMK